MAVKQSRRSISISNALHARLSEHCRLHKIALSAFVETLVSERLDAPPVVLPTSTPPLPPPKKRPLLRPPTAPLRALPPPRSEVHMPQLEGPLPGYVPPIQNW